MIARNIPSRWTSTLLLGAVWGCGAPLSTDQRVLRLLGPEFVFVGVEVHPPPVAPGVRPPPEHPHGFEPQPVPDELEPGGTYVFHNTVPVDHERMALEVLPRRLKALGARIISRPESELDLLYPFLGGVAFGIRFEIDGRKLEIGSSGPHKIYEEPELWYLQDYEISAPDAYDEATPGERGDAGAVLGLSSGMGSPRSPPAGFEDLDFRHVKEGFRIFRDELEEFEELTVEYPTGDLVTVYVSKRSVLTAEDFDLANVVLTDWFGRRKLILLPFTKRGARRFSEWVKGNLGERIGLFLDGILIKWPVVPEDIGEPAAFPIGNLTEQEATELLSRLRRLAAEAK
jgi:hypothetical protein